MFTIVHSLFQFNHPYSLLLHTNYPLYIPHKGSLSLPSPSPPIPSSPHSYTLLSLRAVDDRSTSERRRKDARRTHTP